MAQPTGCGVAGDGTDSLCVCEVIPISELDDNNPAGYIALDPSLVYEAVHNGKSSSGGTSEDTIFLSTNGLPAGDYYPETGLYLLTSGACVRVGPRVGKLWFATATGAGSPTFSISANELRR